MPLAEPDSAYASYQALTGCRTVRLTNVLPGPPETRDQASAFRRSHRSLFLTPTRNRQLGNSDHIKEHSLYEMGGQLPQ